MNERIQELASKAWQYADSNSTDGDGTHGWLYRDKFAELIILECARICEENAENYEFSFTPKRAQIAAASSNKCSYLIKRKMGIK